MNHHVSTAAVGCNGDSSNQATKTPLHFQGCVWVDIPSNNSQSNVQRLAGVGSPALWHVAGAIRLWDLGESARR